jgi:hypothetical protein
VPGVIHARVPLLCDGIHWHRCVLLDFTSIVGFGVPITSKPNFAFLVAGQSGFPNVWQLEPAVH